MALRLRWESIMTLKWIAERLWMVTWMHLNYPKLSVGDCFY